MLTSLCEVPGIALGPIASSLMRFVRNVLFLVSCRMDEVGTAVYAPVDRGQLKEMVSTDLGLVGGAPCDHTPSLVHTYSAVFLHGSLLLLLT